VEAPLTPAYGATSIRLTSTLHAYAYACSASREPTSEVGQVEVMSLLLTVFGAAGHGLPHDP
jgi:hypothetical protein